MERTNTHESQYASRLIEASLDPLIAIGLDGKITDMNQAKVKITGVEREKLINTNFYDYFTDPQKAREAYMGVFKHGSITDFPLTFKHVDGTLTDVLFNGSIFKDDFGNVVGAVVVARDIAEQKWAVDLRNANKELALQNDDKEKKAAELIIANKELAFQNKEKEKRAAELIVANKELAFQNEEKEKRAAELILANKELLFQNEEKEKRAAELILANKELLFQNNEKEKRAAELILANKELSFQNKEKGKRAAELVIADKELVFQTGEKEKRDTANKELEAISYSLKLASQYSLSLIEASRDPLFTISPEGKITDMNQATVRVTGVPREKLIGTDFINYFTDQDQARNGYLEAFEKGFVTDFPLTIMDGKLTHLLCNGSVYKDDNGTVLGVVLVARDITDQKRVANELNEAMVFAEMATAIAEKAKIKAEMATLIAENAVKAKQQFLSNMSHEIRTPMNAIIGFTKVVLKTELTAKQREYLTAIKISGDSLIVLINDILDLAKVDAGKMIFEQIPFKLSKSISAMLNLFEIKIQEKNLGLIKEYDKNIPEVLLGDPVRLHQIILNLVSNAVKFTNEGTIKVSVKLVCQDESKVKIEFSVSDTGIGISESKIEKVFDNFQQASSGTSRLYGGTGLGLAIVKQLVESQGGTNHVESTLGEGSKFSFVLDFLKTNEKVEAEVNMEEYDEETKNIKVLVVEDIPLNQLLMKTLLDDFGFERDIAENGRIAIEKMTSGVYDIVLMDLQMPEMNGFEATEYIRKVMKSDIPIIALTADVTTVDLAKCKAVGMNDYIAKPIDERMLYRKIISQIKKPIFTKLDKEISILSYSGVKLKCTDLHYLMKRTKNNSELMMEMISLYLEQTPPLIKAMKLGLENRDWVSLHAAVHKLIPSFAIMGISSDFEEIARQVKDYADAQQHVGISEMVLKLQDVCEQACQELTEDYNTFKKSQS